MHSVSSSGISAPFEEVKLNAASFTLPSALYLKLNTETLKNIPTLLDSSSTDCVIKLASGLLFFLPFPYVVAVISLLYITLHYSTLLGTLFFTLLYMCARYGGRW